MLVKEASLLVLPGAKSMEESVMVAPITAADAEALTEAEPRSS